MKEDESTPIWQELMNLRKSKVLSWIIFLIFLFCVLNTTLVLIDIGLTPTTEDMLNWGVMQNSLLFLGVNIAGIGVAFVLVPVSKRFGDFFPNVFGLLLLGTGFSLLIFFGSIADYVARVVIGMLFLQCGFSISQTLMTSIYSQVLGQRDFPKKRDYDGTSIWLCHSMENGARYLAWNSCRIW